MRGDARGRVLSAVLLSLLGYSVSPKGHLACDIGWPWPVFFRSKLPECRRGARVKLSVHRWETVLPSREPKDLGQKLLGFLPYPFVPYGSISAYGGKVSKRRP